MGRLLSVLLLACLLCSVGVALAMDQPTVTRPAAGDALGPNYDIIGSVPSKAVIVVITDCVRTDTNEVVGSVPGIRHWTNASGGFAFRCASPRVFLGDNIPLVYRVRCFEVDRSGDHGPETVVECSKAR